MLTVFFLILMPVGSITSKRGQVIILVEIFIITHHLFRIEITVNTIEAGLFFCRFPLHKIMNQLLLPDNFFRMSKHWCEFHFLPLARRTFSEELWFGQPIAGKKNFSVCRKRLLLSLKRGNGWFPFDLLLLIHKILSIEVTLRGGLSSYSVDFLFIPREHS